MATTTRTHHDLLEIDPPAFAEGFARRPFAVRHSLVDHPLLTPDAIAELADAMPISAVERHRSDLPLVLPDGAPELDGRPSDSVRELETGRVWMVLWNIEQVPEYKVLLDACLDEVERLVGDRHGGMRDRKAYLFLSAPGAVTPAHFDPEHNLLLQIRGTKEMTVGRFADPADQQRELDRYHGGGHRNLERIPEDATPFVLEPGEGVYVYPFAPHWVRNGEAASVSLSITFRTHDSRRVERVHRFNARLRKLGLSPRPAGSSRARDRAKAAVMEAKSRLRRRRTSGRLGD